jgi:hypothetical protein
MFKFFTPTAKEQELIDLLKQSRQDFRFEQDKVKMKLLVEIRSQEKLPKPSSLNNFGWALTRGLAFMVLVVFAGTGVTFAYASNALPGDKFYSINYWGDKTLLSLPLPSETKLWVHTKMANKRLQEIHTIHNDVSISPKIKADALRHTNEVLKQTIQETSAALKILNEAGQTDKTEKIKNFSVDLKQEMNSILEKNELEDLKDTTEDADLKNQINLELEKIRGSGQKMKEEWETKKSEQEDIRGINLTREEND